MVKSMRIAHNSRLQYCTFHVGVQVLGFSSLKPDIIDLVPDCGSGPLAVYSHHCPIMPNNSHTPMLQWTVLIYAPRQEGSTMIGVENCAYRNI